MSMDFSKFFDSFFLNLESVLFPSPRPSACPADRLCLFVNDVRLKKRERVTRLGMWFC